MDAEDLRTIVARHCTTMVHNVLVSVGHRPDMMEAPQQRLTDMYIDRLVSDLQLHIHHDITHCQCGGLLVCVNYAHYTDMEDILEEKNASNQTQHSTSTPHMTDRRDHE